MTRSRSRIGSDEARTWVRKLRLGNPYAKAILMAIANYMNEDGMAYPGIATLHADTEIAEDTIVSRLRWCEGIGAIALFKCWVDEHGRRNSEGRGRPTSSEIRFLLDADPEMINANAINGSKPRSLRGAALASHETKDSSPRPDGEQTAEFSPRPHGELNEVSSRLAPEQPPTPADRIEEQKKEERTPNPLSGGVRTIDVSESFKPFAESYPAPITDMAKALTIWAAMTDTERIDALTGAKGYRFYIDGERQAKRNRAVKDAHRWLRDKLWLGYLRSGKTAEAAAERFDAREDSDEWKAWTVFYRCCGQSGIPSFLISDRSGSRSANLPMRWPPIGREYDPNSGNWTSVVSGTGQCAAWLRRLRELPGVRVAMKTILKDGHSVPALIVPSDWPPNRGATGPPSQPSDDDLSALANEFSK